MTTPRRPDESMTLLVEMMERPLDPSYAAAAQRREAAGGPPSRSWNSPWVVLVMTVAGIVMGVSAVNLGPFAQPVERAQAREHLVERIGAREEAVAARSAEITRLHQDIRRLQGTALADDPAQARRLADLGLAAGATQVSGPGLRVTLDDRAGVDVAPGAQPRDVAGDSEGRVVARDIVYLTNALWQSGAEAIAVNGHRLTSTTAIRAAGVAITVGFRPLSRPYIVEAVAGPQTVTEFQDGVGGAYLAELRDSYQVRTDAGPVASLTLPATAALSLRHATVPATDDEVDQGRPASLPPTSPSKDRP